MELKKPGVTLLIPWEGYRSAHPYGYDYSHFCELTEVSEAVSSKSRWARPSPMRSFTGAGLAAFLEDGRIEVDSNVVERSMKSVPLTRKYSLDLQHSNDKCCLAPPSLRHTLKMSSHPLSRLSTFLHSAKYSIVAVRAGSLYGRLVRDIRRARKWVRINR